MLNRVRYSYAQRNVKKNLVDANCEEKHLKVNLTGGLGNQLFQFAVGVNLALNLGNQIAFTYNKGSRKFNLSFLGVNTEEFYCPRIVSGNLELTPAISCKHDLLNLKFNSYYESGFNYRPIELSNKDNELFGYFQSPKYSSNNFKNICTYIKSSLNGYGENISDEVVVHIRLGDMATNPIARNYHGVLNEEYYLDAISEHFSMKKIVIVTEDIKQAREYFPKVTMMADKFFSHDPVSDLATMSRAKQLIIANSTLSLWAAYLAEGVTIVPRSWFAPKVLIDNPTTDLFLKEWQQR